MFLTTHYMEEAEQADYVVVIDAGRVAAEGTPQALKREYAADSLKLYGDADVLIKLLEGTDAQPVRFPGGIKIKLLDTVSALPLLERTKEAITGFETAMGNMDDAFIGITGKEIRE